MNMLLRLLTSSLGKKFLMAVTGAGLFLFVIGHLLGNLQIFLGPEAVNRYGHFLQTTPEILWPARVGLLAFVIIHIWTSISLTLENRAARAARYDVKEVVAATLASRTMIWSGLIIVAFVAFHLAHYTLLIVHPEFRDLHDANGWHDIYRMMVLGFSTSQPRREQHVPIAGLEERGLSAVPRQSGAGGRGADLPRLYLHPSRDSLRLWKGSTEVNLDAKIPTGPLAAKWDKHKFDLKLVNPSNKRKFDIIVVGSGLAGASAAASLAELGYQVKCFCFQDSPRRAHSIAAQGGINAAKNYQNDGDSVYRLFYDTIKGATSARARPTSIVSRKSA
jgi:succinate dehydrogenase/fumarate reductase cytochrome b subunit (b558 family)